MPNENTQEPWQQPLNPDVVNLSKSIALQEGGGQVNYDASGDNGTSSGAYQWQPGNFQSEATQYGLDPDDFSPENQDKVAYSQVYSLSKEFKNDGYPDAEIPSMVSASWNAGKGAALSGSWKTNMGTTDINGKQIAYNTPAYVQGVAKYYNQFSGQNQQQGQSSQGQPQTQPQAQTNKPWYENPWITGALGIGTAGLGLAALQLVPGVDVAVDTASLGAGLEATGAGVIGDVAGDVAGATGGEEVATEGSSLLSKAIGAGKGALGAYGVEQGINAIKGVTGQGGNQEVPSQQGQNGTIPNQAIPSQTSNIENAVRSPSFTPQSFSQSNNASQQIYNALDTALKQTPTGTVFNTTPEAQNGKNFNALYGIVPDGTNGTYDIAGALGKSQGLIGGLDDAAGQVLSQGNEQVNLKDAAESDKAALLANPHTNLSLATEAAGHIDKQYADLASRKGNTVSLSDFHKFKKDQGQLSRFDIKNPISGAKRMAHKAITTGSKQTILKTIQDPERKELYSNILKHESGLYDGQKVLKKLKNKKAHPHHSFLNQAGRRLAQYAEIAIGARIGGPVGAVMGAFVGHQLERVVDKKFGKSVMEQPNVQKALAIADKTSPQVRQLINETLQTVMKRSQNRLTLPAPSFIPMGAKTPPPSGIKQPEKPGGLYEHLKNIEDSRKAVGLNVQKQKEENKEGLLTKRLAKKGKVSTK